MRHLGVMSVCLVFVLIQESLTKKIHKEIKEKAIKKNLVEDENGTTKSSSKVEPKPPVKNNAGANSSSSEDYDTTQGYPILFPETHMKRNTSANISTSEPIDDDVTSEEVYSNGSVPLEERDKCSKTVDLLFLLDSSESVKYSNWKIVIQFVKSLCNRFKLSTTRVGIIRYASDAEIALHLTRFNDTASRDTAIDNIFYKTGGTRTDIALKKAADVFQFSEQKNQVLILVTDGPTNSLEINKDHFVEGKDLVAGPVDRLKDAGVAIFCIGIVPDSETPDEIETMKEEMRVIASEPTKLHLFMSDGYHELQRKVHAISEAACVVNGAWSRWSDYSPCSVSCGEGTKVRMRSCTSPKPENNGADCTGRRVETEECFLGPCSFTEKLYKPENTSEKILESMPKKIPEITLNKKLENASQTVLQKSNDGRILSDTGTNLNNSLQNETQAQSPLLRLTNGEVFTNGPSEGINQTLNFHENSVFDFPTKSLSLPTKSNNSSKILNLISNNTQPTKEASHFIGGCFEGLEEIKLSDSQYNASSVYSHDTEDEYVKREYAPQNARLNNVVNGGGWCAEHKYALLGDKNQYLQFDLGKQMTVDGVVTQGSHLLENWVKSFNLRFSDDAISWEYYKNNPLDGNSDRHTERRNHLNPPITARYIQINPIGWNEDNGIDKHDICLRAALYKCRDGAVAAVKRAGINTLRGNNIVKSAHHPTGSHVRIFSVNSKTKRQHVPMLNHKNNQHKRILHRLRTIANKIIIKVKKAGKKFQT